MAEPVRLETTILAIRDLVSTAKRSGKTVALVPTMGALHAGHSRLIEQARQNADFVVVSIFVNPTQFGPNEDYSRYPRSLEDDLTLCQKAGADLVFHPDVTTIYPSGQLDSFVEVPQLSAILEGASRPGHFRGVATIVLKLVLIAAPDLAFFGEKDYQQLLIIKRVAADLDVPVAVKGVPIVREADGLAMSSRNRYLGPEDRRAAAVLFEALGLAAEAVRSGERNAERVRQILRGRIESERRAALDYAEVADADTLKSLETLESDRRAVALLAVKVGPARLIDNMLLPV